MKHKIIIQKIVNETLPIKSKDIKNWTNIALDHIEKLCSYEICIRIVSPAEIQELNKQYRKKNKPTNVLAFPNSIPEYYANKKTKFIGDLIICPIVLEQEAIKQKISLSGHWAHIIIHGILHLFGHDHMHQQDALIMQEEEIALLRKIGYDNPYEQ